MKVPYTKCGKCGDTVYQRNRFGQISYPYHIPRNPRTVGQQQVRGAFGSVSARWRTLREEQRLAWCVAAKSERTRRRLGQRWPLNGFNYFVRVNVILANRGQAQMDLPPTESMPPARTKENPAAMPATDQKRKPCNAMLAPPDRGSCHPKKARCVPTCGTAVLRVATYWKRMGCD